MNFHVLDQAEDQKTINVVFHYPVPAVNNIIGISYRTALVSFSGGPDAIVSVLSDISEPELTSLKAGELFEYKGTLRWSRLGLTDAQKLAEIQAAYTAVNIEINAYFGTVLAYYGHKGDVA